MQNLEIKIMAVKYGSVQDMMVIDKATGRSYAKQWLHEFLKCNDHCEYINVTSSLYKLSFDLSTNYHYHNVLIENLIDMLYQE